MNKKNNYTTKEVGEILGVSDRTVQRYLKSYYALEKGVYTVSDKMLEILKEEYLEQESDMVVEEFTSEQYDHLKYVIADYPVLKEQLAYHRKSAENHERQMEKLIDLMLQRNFIEAKDKKIDKHG